MTQNDPRESEMRKRLTVLYEGLESFRKDTGTPIHIKDFSGFMLSNPVLGELVGNYLFHESGFCTKVKSVREVREKCVISSNELLMNRLTAIRGGQNSQRPYSGLSDGFYGNCWCGIREYVYPVCHGDVVIGAVLAGSYRADARSISHSFSRLCVKYGFDRMELTRLYDESTLTDTPEIESRVAILAGYLSMLAEYYIDHSLVIPFSKGYQMTRRHKLVSLATEYITMNLAGKISVADMAVYCMCSKSTLNHLFRSALGRTIPEFVTAQRVSRAKYLLLNTELSIEQIAAACGFSSGTYFSVVFKKLSDMTPTEYRSKTTGASKENITGLL